jgi:hypothetical protein
MDAGGINAHDCPCGLACVLNKIRAEKLQNKEGGEWAEKISVSEAEVVEVRWLRLSRLGDVRRPLIANVPDQGRLQFNVRICTACYFTRMHCVENLPMYKIVLR